MPAQETLQACHCVYDMGKNLLIVLLYLSGAFCCTFITRHLRQKPSWFSASTWLFVAFFDAFLLATLSSFESRLVPESNLEQQLAWTAALIAATALCELLVRLAIEADRRTRAR